MSIKQLQEADHTVVGTKQTIRAVESGQALKVFLAEDVDSSLWLEINQLCEEYQVPVESVSTMAELGRTVDIEVKAAVAAMLR